MIDMKNVTTNFSHHQLAPNYIVVNIGRLLNENEQEYNQ